MEDDQAQADTLKSILEASGFAVLQASTVEDAIRSFRQDPTVSLVLADHMLSGKMGTELAAQIKKIKRTVPIVMHSGTALVSMRNIDGFIDKGEPSATLVAFIAEIVPSLLGINRLSPDDAQSSSSPFFWTKSLNRL